MEQFEEHIADPLGFALDQAPQFLETDLQAADESSRQAEHSEESAFTDDPVRVYLREMGSVSLLTRQAEVELARRMERGTFRIQKAMSRSVLVRRIVLGMYDQARSGQVPIEDFVHLRGEDEAAEENERREALRHFARLTKLNSELMTLEQKFQRIPSRNSRVRALAMGRILRLKVMVSQEIRAIRFYP